LIDDRCFTEWSELALKDFLLSREFQEKIVDAPAPHITRPSKYSGSFAYNSAISR
jgi:hypothetical protein